MACALLVFPASDPGADSAEAACTAAGWTCERAAQPGLALVRLIRPDPVAPAPSLLVVSVGLGGLGAAGLAKAARSHHGDLAIIVVGTGVALAPPAWMVPAGDDLALRSALLALRAPSLPPPPAAPTADPGLIDPEVVQLLHAIPGLFDRARAAFAGDLPGHLADIERAAGTGDLPGLHRAAHALKGAAGSLGACVLHDLLTRLDQAARRGDAAQAAVLLPGLRPLAERSLAALKRS